MEKILTVEDRFDIAQRGLVVVPGPLATAYLQPCTIEVELRRPEGSSRAAMLELQHVFQTPPSREKRYAALFRGLSKDDVPIGTEVWSVST